MKSSPSFVLTISEYYLPHKEGFLCPMIINPARFLCLSSLWLLLYPFGYRGFHRHLTFFGSNQRGWTSELGTHTTWRNNIILPVEYNSASHGCWLLRILGYPNDMLKYLPDLGLCISSVIFSWPRSNPIGRGLGFVGLLVYDEIETLNCGLSFLS